MDSSEGLQALVPGELELIVSCASASDIKFLGSSAWVEWHQRFQKLHQQAVLEAVTDQEEITKDAIVSSGKIPVLIHEAICISIWRQKVLPLILKMDEEISNTFLLYAILYHETIAVGLLELTVFDEEACQSVSELIIDLIDYCVEMIMGLVALVNSGYLEPKPISIQISDKVYEELNRQSKDLQFDIGIRCITIISCLANILDKIHISATARLYSKHDTLLLMAQLLQLEPWHRKDHRGNDQFYAEGHWKDVEDGGEKLCRAETLTWLAVWRLVLNSEIGNNYDMNEFRKSQLCKLLYRITESHMDQIPVLGELKRSLGHLGVANVSSTNQTKRQPVLIEVVPQIRPVLLKNISKNAKSIAKAQLEKYFQLETKDLVELAKKLSISYTSEVLEHMDDGGPNCAHCKEVAAKKCSRCKNEWYCGRECQVKHWEKHKKSCDQFISSQDSRMK